MSKGRLPIDSAPGTRVRYHGVTDDQVLWGSCGDPRGVLKYGAVYTVKRMEVHTWHTKVHLVEVGGAFPSAAFHRAREGKGVPG